MTDIDDLIADTEQHYQDGLITRQERNRKIARLRSREETDTDPENIYGLASIRQSIEEDRK